MSPAYEISIQQQRLWPRRSTSDRSTATRVLPGGPDTRTLTAAVDSVLAAHEVLTTTFAARPGWRFPVQTPGTAAPPALTVDADATSGDLIACAIAAAKQAPLNVETGPVLAVAVAHNAQTSALAVAAHPLVADSRSAGLIAAELASALAGTPPVAGVRYVAYADWQRSSEDGTARGGDLGLQ